MLFSAIPFIIILAVTLIAMKREVAAGQAGFPWSECQVRKLTTSHCTNNMVYRTVDDVAKQDAFWVIVDDDTD